MHITANDLVEVEQKSFYNDYSVHKLLDIVTHVTSLGELSLVHRYSAEFYYSA